VADREDAAVDAMEAAVADAPGHLFGREAAPTEFIEGEDAPLLRGEASDPHVGPIVDFSPVEGVKSTTGGVGGVHALTVPEGV
jgi:hypothetical protein